MYTYNYNAKDAVVKLREVRKKCIEKNSQMRYCCKFKKFIVQLRKIFTNEKYEVDYFIKHQCDLSIDDSYKNIYIPKIIWLCLDILFDLYFYEYNSFDNVTIYKGLNGSLDITDEDIKEIIKIVDELNNGNWDILVKNNKVIIITEIFYNWLEDSVTYCISPKRINEIFKEPNFILNIFKILNENCIDDNIIESIYENITFHLKKVELEIARYIAHFLNDIYPNEINEKSESFIEYKRMVEKISIYMLGFNIDLLLFFKSKSEENLSDDLIQEDLDYGIELTIKDCINAIDNFLHILEFLRIKIQLNVKKSYTNKTNISPENERITNIDKKRTENLNINHIFSLKENEYERKKNYCCCCNNKINLSILERVSKNRNFKKTSSPIKSHLLKLNQKEQNNDSNFSYFLNPKNKNVRPDAAAAASAQRSNVDIRLYSVIYECLEEIEAAMKGMLAPKYREAVIGHAEVRVLYKVSAIGTVAGCYVKDGKITRDCKVRVLRDNVVIYTGELGSLQRFKDSVKEVQANFECGMSVAKYNDLKEGDIFECFVMEQYRD